jgi:DNA-directed RNA polymerase specialized sigma24 family protein
MKDDDIEGLTERLKRADTTEEKDRLWRELVPKLHRIARNRINAAGRQGIESPTELVNEVYPGLQRALDRPSTSFENRAHFLAYAAQAMRRHIAAQAKKPLADELLDEHFAVDSASPALQIALEEAVDTLAERFPRAVRAWELREYGGYSYEEILHLMADQYRTKALIAADLTLVRKALADLLRQVE